MGKTSFDPLDIGLLVVSLMSAFIMTNIATFDLFGVDFGASLFSVAGFGFSTAYVLSAGAVVGVIATNDNTSFAELRSDIEGLDRYYAGAVAVTLGSLVLWVVSPTFVDFVQSEDLWGLVYTMIITTGTLVLGWIL